jgi:hypothetical protein
MRECYVNAEGHVRAHYFAAMAATMATPLIAVSVYSTAQDNPPAITNPPASAPTREPTVTVLERHEAQGVLGKEVRSTAGENMGRIVDVLVDPSGQARAAIIDFGGFLGVGSRKIAVAWNALHFPPGVNKPNPIALELTRDQVRAAPEYKEDKTVVVLGASGDLESLPDQ